MDGISKDDRFAKINKDPRFRRIPKKERKVKIDKRFKDMFTDKKFKLKYSVDKRGKPINSTTNENFRKYYDISDSEDEDKMENMSSKQASSDTCEIDEVLEENKKKEINDNELQEGPDDKELQEDSDDHELQDQDSESEESGLGSGPDLARGEGNVETSSEEEDSDDEDNDNDDNLVTNIADLDRDAIEAPEITCRLAVCNMDWDRVKAQDIFVLLQSFQPTGGLIKSVKIYPSEFGLQRMKIEAEKGPTELTERSENTDHDGEDIEGGSFHTEKLRKYQLNRLKYYYAVVECDSTETANKIYEECDNMEYESSSNKLDLRFIPNDMTFEHEPKNVCTELPTSYQPSLFFTTALCQSKVDLTWDETDHDRLKVTMNPSIGKKTKKGKSEIKEEDFKAYLASSSDEDDEPTDDLAIGDDSGSESESEENQIDKYRSLVQTIKESEEKKKKRDIEMEITWEPGLKESTEKMVKKKDKEKDLTVWEKYLEKKKEKKQKKRKEKKTPESTAVEEDNSESDQQAFSDDEIPDDIKSDPFFQDIDVEKKTKKKKKGKKKSKQIQSTDEKEFREKNEAELSLLMMDEDNEEEERKHFSLKKLMQDASGTKKKKTKKGSSEKGDDFKVDISDPRFEALYTSHMYNIDPSVPEYKKTKGMQYIVEAKQTFRKKDLKRKRSPNDKNLTETKTVKLDSDKTKDGSLQKLVESVKMKTKQYKNKK